jgi:hypothetical protein
MATKISKVYLFIHELFGVFWTKNHVQLVTPHLPPMKKMGMPGHTYKIARFKDRQWRLENDVLMNQCCEYKLHGVADNSRVPLKHMLDNSHSALPLGGFDPPDMPPESPSKPDPTIPHCRWILPFPNKIHQLRLIGIPRRLSPFFTLPPHGEQVENDIQSAFSIVQVFEYLPHPHSLPCITERRGDDQKTLPIDCRPDTATGTVNLHLWAQMEDESSITSVGAANDHARCACEALVALFHGLQLDVRYSIGTDNFFESQPAMPYGIQFAELLTLSERFTLAQKRAPLDGEFHPDCVPSTCGSGTNIYGCSPDGGD